jgi:predicted permease
MALPAEALARVATAAALVAAGAVARAAGGVRLEDGGALLRVIFNVTLPAVLLSTFVSLPLGGGAAGGTEAAVVANAVAHAAALGLASAFAWERQGGKAAGQERRAPRDAALLAGATMGLNLGLFCYPFAEAVWGAPGLQTVVLFDLANHGVLLIACYLAFWVRLRGKAAGAEPTNKAGAHSGSLWGALRARMLNPCLVALYGAAALRCAGVHALPSAVEALASPLAAANKPLALLALGILLDLRPPRGQLATVAAVLVRSGRIRAQRRMHAYPIQKQQRADAAHVCCVRASQGLRLSISLAVAAAAVALLGGGGAFGGALAALPVLPAATLGAVAAALTSPVPMLTLTYAQEFNCDVALAALLVNVSNAVSFALLVAVVQLSAGAPGALAPAAAAGAVIAAVIGSLGADAARQANATRVEVATGGNGAAPAARGCGGVGGAFGRAMQSRALLRAPLRAPALAPAMLRLGRRGATRQLRAAAQPAPARSRGIAKHAGSTVTLRCSVRASAAAAAVHC